MTVRTVALILIICLCIPMFPVTPVTAVAQDENGIDPLAALIAGAIDASDLYPALEESAVPEIIGYENAVTKNHIQRLYEEEGNDLNKLVFLNVDGSKTMYAFDFPVKYLDENGKPRDISLEIADSHTAQVNFQSAAHSAMTTFSARMSDGISLSGNNTEITLVPILNTNLEKAEASAHVAASAASVAASPEATRVDDKTIAYRYDDKTSIEYSLTYTGFKEDIVVSEYTGQTEYLFTLYTNGYNLTKIKNSYYLTDAGGNIKATIGDIIIFTADNGNNTFGEIVPTTIVPNEEYLLTIVVDEEFLSDENTVYPIRIDPTVEINYNNNGVGAIEDVTVYTNDTSAASSGSLFAGLKQTAGISRVLMKFPGLDLDDLGSNVVITNATVSLRDLMCETTPLDVYCNVYAGPDWTDSSTTWANTFGASANSISTFLSMNTMSRTNGANLTTPHWYSFDITKAVQGWIDGNYSQNKGIVFKASDAAESGTAYNHKTMGSYNNASYKPTLSITYTSNNYQLIANGTYYLNNRGCGNYLKYASASSIVGSSGLLSSLGTSIQWQIQKVGAGYVIRAANNPSIYLGVPVSTTSNAVEAVSVSNAVIPERCIWNITIALGNGGGCEIKNAYNSRYLYTYGNTLFTSSTVPYVDSNSYCGYTWRIVSTDSYGNSNTHPFQELTGFSISDMRIDVGQTSVPIITTSSSLAIWTDASDFDFTYTSEAHFANDPMTGAFTAYSRGPSLYVLATHKVTHLNYLFSVTANSNLTTFISMLGSLYDIAYSYKNGNQTAALEATFNFIRSQKYYNELWRGVAGEKDNSFFYHVYEIDPDVFSYFICDSYYLNNSNYIIMLPDVVKDPSNQSIQEIDVLHMSAILNRYFYTGSTSYEGIPTLGLLEEEIDALCGWAGDFQALIRDYFELGNAHTNTEDIMDAFYPMIGSDYFYCSYSDIISDIDACNLYMLLSNSSITNGSQLENIFESYYFGTTGNVATKRFTVWIDTNDTTVLSARITKYCNDHSPVFVKWPILNDYSIYEYQQEAFTDAFVTYLFTQKNRETLGGLYYE